MAKGSAGLRPRRSLAVGLGELKFAFVVLVAEAVAADRRTVYWWSLSDWASSLYILQDISIDAAARE